MKINSRQILILLFFTVTLSSCQRRLKYMYDINRPEIKIKINGFYYNNTGKTYHNDTIYNYIFFYANGTMLRENSNNLDSFKNMINSDTTPQKRKWVSKYPGWGRYTTKNDTIVLRELGIRAGRPSVVFESYFVILNDTSFYEIDKLKDNENYNHNIFHFEQYKIKPDSINWTSKYEKRLSKKNNLK